MKRFYFFLVIMLGFNNLISGSELVIRYPRPEMAGDVRHKYYLEILKMALEKTKTSDGSFQLIMAEKQMNQSRALAQLRNNRDIEIVWTMTSKKRETELLPIRFPLLKGMLGYRIFIIRKGDEARFKAVQTLEDLKQLKAGQGMNWPDTQILKANGLNVTGVAGYNNLFAMLQNKRFDYFPRGVNEPWAEIKTHEDKNLVVEETLLLKYYAPIYFFVNKKNIQLADRIERGLRFALKDGSFNHLFYHNPANKEVFALAKIKQRKLFKLNNLLLTPETPLDEKELWYTP